ncbi:hypothetical protein MKFW12EY_00800 [Methylomonas koyamae]|nr:hypothetical protein MKFW12EY_00800 [Methylomonas koyamae]
MPLRVLSLLKGMLQKGFDALSPNGIPVIKRAGLVNQMRWAAPLQSAAAATA